MDAMEINQTASGMIAGPVEYVCACTYRECIKWLDRADSWAVSGPVGCLDILGKAREAIERNRDAKPASALR